MKNSNTFLNSSVIQRKVQEFKHSFDNKENHSINYNEFSPSRIDGKYSKGYPGVPV